MPFSASPGYGYFSQYQPVVSLDGSKRLGGAALLNHFSNHSAETPRGADISAKMHSQCISCCQKTPKPGRQHQGWPAALIEPDATVTKSLDSIGKPGGSHYQRLYVWVRRSTWRQKHLTVKLDLQHVFIRKYHDWLFPKDKQGRAHRRTLKQKKKKTQITSVVNLVGFLYELPPICLQQEQMNRCKKGCQLNCQEQQGPGVEKF
ncbi:uncharacterized protein PADG_06151 [Paracoccidioides brasiliensis Pb18]|uniref:Uncharacterized protein n=1 Tax=Paracoccidioides brasiliensis (strain Pb18) TaxID=502780 RepID=C1GFW5_PARBD|nr:uncharacterized protein PADG_06151 [Paracoccidioides brasiliensis Pb18]EEH50072.2 hypothetical protein PADG_06151 [Paracoccidioides brasiliensis Pb18]